LIGGFFGAILVYAGVKRVCEIKFGPYEGGQKKNNRGRQW
jgi:hypothetical protein